jgi:hypothetical protein
MMSSLEAKMSSPEAKKSDQFSALLAFADVRDLTAATLANAIRGLYPDARVTGWGGSGAPTDGVHGILLSVNSVDLAVTNIKSAAPPQAFSGGNQPDFCWQNAKAELEQHKSHTFVIEAAASATSRSLERARAVTIVVDAVADLKSPMGLMWVNAKNLVRFDHFTKLMEGFRAGRTLPVAMWVRMLIATLPPASASAASCSVAGTFGLHLFGSPNIEIHSSRLTSRECLSAALSYAESRLTTGQPTWDEATTTIEDFATFRIERLGNGLFGIGPVAKLVDAN